VVFGMVQPAKQGDEQVNLPNSYLN
jgi:hypothetical protein